MSNETSSTIIPDALNEGFCASTGDCTHHGSMTTEMMAFIQGLIKEAQEAHGVTDIIVCQGDCDCPICRGQLEQCEDCDGIFLIDKDEEYVADLDRGEEADFESIPCLSPIVSNGTLTARSMFFDYEEEEDMPLFIMSTG